MSSHAAARHFPPDRHRSCFVTRLLSTSAAPLQAAAACSDFWRLTIAAPVAGERLAFAFCSFGSDSSAGGPFSPNDLSVRVPRSDGRTATQQSESLAGAIDGGHRREIPACWDKLATQAGGPVQRRGTSGSANPRTEREGSGRATPGVGRPPGEGRRWRPCRKRCASKRIWMRPAQAPSHRSLAHCQNLILGGFLSVQHHHPICTPASLQAV